MKYKFYISDELRDLIRHFPPALKQKMNRAFDILSKDPTKGKPLIGNLNDLRSYRMGKYRIVYRVARTTIDIALIGPRKSIYKELTVTLLRAKSN